MTMQALTLLPVIPDQDCQVSPDARSACYPLLACLYHLKVADNVMKKAEHPTLEDVAEVAGVSTATISRSINEPDKVAKSTQERIQAVILELGYTPNIGGRILASNRSNTVGAIIPTMADAMFASGLQAFQEELSRAGVTMLVASSGYSNEEELKQIRSLIAHGADGLLLIGDQRAKETLDFLALRNIPHVISWCYKSDTTRTFAGFDNKKAAGEMTRHVLDQGHRRIAMIAGRYQGNDRASDRMHGVKRMVKAYGNDAELLEIIEAAGYLMEDGGDAFEQLMSRNVAPTAIICGNDVLAAGAVVRSQQIGVKIPEDVSVTGFGDISLATAVTPMLTTVRVPHTTMGRTAAKLLLEMVSGDDKPESVRFDNEIVTRKSLAAPKANK